MDEYTISIITENNSRYYYTNKKGYNGRITLNRIYANKYKEFSIAKGVSTRLRLFEYFSNIRYFKSLNIDKYNINQ